MLYVTPALQRSPILLTGRPPGDSDSRSGRVPAAEIEDRGCQRHGRRAAGKPPPPAGRDSVDAQTPHQARNGLLLGGCLPPVRVQHGPHVGGVPRVHSQHRELDANRHRQRADCQADPAPAAPGARLQSPLPLSLTLQLTLLALITRRMAVSFQCWAWSTFACLNLRVLSRVHGMCREEWRWINAGLTLSFCGGVMALAPKGVAARELLGPVGNGALLGLLLQPHIDSS